MHKTGFFECHATGTSSGDPEEAKAVASVFGSKGGVYIGSVKVGFSHRPLICATPANSSFSAESGPLRRGIRAYFASQMCYGTRE